MKRNAGFLKVSGGSISLRNGVVSSAIRMLVVVAASMVAGTILVSAQSGPPPGGPPGKPPDWRVILKQPRPILTINRPQTKTNGKLTVTSSSFGPNGKMPKRCTSYGKSISPEVSWSAGPKGTKSYVLFMEDATAGINRVGVLHWMAFNIPADVTSLPEGLPHKPAGMIVAQNQRGKAIYMGPHSPVGAPPFHYEIQIFALNKKLDFTAAVSREQIWAAMNGHVLAKGGVKATFQGPAK